MEGFRAQIGILLEGLDALPKTVDEWCRVSRMHFGKQRLFFFLKRFESVVGASD